MFHQTFRFLAFAAILTWSSTAAAVPIFSVSASTNPIVGGIVQLHQGDQNVSITFEIVPDPNEVKQFSVNFSTGTSTITVDSCASPVLGAVANCPFAGEGGTNFDFKGGFGDNARSAPFTAGTVVLSLGNAVIGTVIQVRSDTPSFIADMNFTETDLRGQNIAQVVPEPGTAALLGLGFAGLGIVGRSRRGD